MVGAAWMVAAMAIAAAEPALEGASALGSTGLVRVLSADAGAPGSLRIQLLNELSRSRETFAHDPPDTHTRFGFKLSLGYSPRSWLELFASLQGSVHDNTRIQGSPLSTFGDVLVGVKGCARVGSACLGALAAALFLPGGAPEASYTFRSTSFLLRLLARGWIGKSAMWHLNAGAILDNSGALLSMGLGPAERYAYRLAEYNRVFGGLGIELRVSDRVVPFLEWTIEVPVGGPGAAGFSSFPHLVTAGARVFPRRDVSLLMGLDLAATTQGRLGVPSVPPWQILIGLGWGFVPERARRPFRREPDLDDDL